MNRQNLKRIKNLPPRVGGLVIVNIYLPLHKHTHTWIPAVCLLSHHHWWPPKGHRCLSLLPASLLPENTTREPLSVKIGFIWISLKKKNMLSHRVRIKVSPRSWANVSAAASAGRFRPSAVAGRVLHGSTSDGPGFLRSMESNPCLEQQTLRGRIGPPEAALIFSLSCITQNSAQVLTRLNVRARE